MTRLLLSTELLQRLEEAAEEEGFRKESEVKFEQRRQSYLKKLDKCDELTPSWALYREFKVIESGCLCKKESNNMPEQERKETVAAEVKALEETEEKERSQSEEYRQKSEAVRKQLDTCERWRDQAMEVSRMARELESLDVRLALRSGPCHT